MLKAPRDTVLARTATGLVALSRRLIPERFGARGVLVYGLFEPPPSALVIRAPDGRSVTQPLGESRAFVEQCEGEAEPATPATVQPSG